tara:strand:- start:172 stop:513 length:342 start_codon:yes stop_codon:yes gene_type:complete
MSTEMINIADITPPPMVEKEEKVKEWWGLNYTDERGNTMTFFKATEKWVEENAEDKYNEYGELEYFRDNRLEEESDSDEEEEEDDDVLKCPDSYSKWGKCPPEMCYDCDESRK